LVFFIFNKHTGKLDEPNRFMSSLGRDKLCLFLNKYKDSTSLQNLLDNRKETILSTIRDAEECYKEAEEKLKQAKSRLQQAKLKADEIRIQGLTQLEKEKAELIKTADEDSKKLEESKNGTIRFEEQKALEEVRQQVSRLALERALETLRVSLNTDLQNRLIDSNISILTKLNDIKN
jgi:F-type H+-transporting ATPase subunit b